MVAPTQVRSHLRYPLTSLLGSAGNVRVLRVLMADGLPRSAAQLAAATGLTPQGVRLVLDLLTRQRLVTAHGSGRARLYVKNPAHPLADSLASLFRDEQSRWDVLLDSIREVLKKRGTAVSAGWLYGSVARGEDTPLSDLDIALVVRTHSVADRVREDLMPIEDAHQLRISLTALTPRELSVLPENDPWWSEVVRDGRGIKGSTPDETRRRVEQGARMQV